MSENLSIEELRSITEKRSRFRVVMSGFDKQQVNEYIDQLSATYEKLMREQQEAFEALKAEKEILIRRFDYITSEIAERSAECKKAKEEEAAALAIVEPLKQEIEALKSGMTRIKADLDAAITAGETVTEHNKTLTEQVNDKKRIEIEYNKTQTRVQELEEKEKNFQDSMQEKEDVINNLSSMVETISSEAKSEQEEHQKQMQQLKDSFEETTRQLSEDNKKKRKMLKEIAAMLSDSDADSDSDLNEQPEAAQEMAENYSEAREGDAEQICCS